MQVVPVAGHDSMLMNLSGAHGQKPGLGVELDFEQLEKHHQLYKDTSAGARDDAAAMQFLIPGWKYDNKRPALVR
ncbi:MAG TPA: hypothetical protein VGC82_07745 [Rhodopila sp.]